MRLPLKFRSILISALLFTFTAGLALAQNGMERRKSPLNMARVEHNDTYIKITYSQPQMKGRDVFGSLVPYKQVWRTGANEATEMTVTQPITMNGKNVKAGTYAIFSIPMEDQWTIILNSDVGQWGAFGYNEEFDVLRFNVPTIRTEEPVEVFTISFSEVEDNQTTLSMMWENTKVEIPITF
ncbi:MAG: DUF2911 domain-containing protein [Bacteroidota bacterium]